MTPSRAREEAGPPEGTSPESRYNVLFLEAARSQLRGVQLPMWAIVLTPKELAKAQEHFGLFFPLNVELYFDAKKDQALIEWDEHWRGGTFVARKKDGKWVLESRGAWVT